MPNAIHARAISAVVIAVVGTAFLTSLLAKNLIGVAPFAVLAPTVWVIALIVYLAERLREFSLKDLSVKLDEVRQVKAEAEELYSKIDHLQQSTMTLDDERMAALGTAGGARASINAAMRYPVGCMKRARERLARIFAEPRSPEKIALAIRDDSYDDLVFKFNGPETPLDAPPVSLAERRAKAERESQAKTAAKTDPPSKG
jgi:hypothetical protein